MNYFLVVRYVKEFIYSIDEMVINFPRKDFVIKDRIINDSLDILELIYLANIDNDNMLKNNIISEKVLKKYSNKIANITRLIYGWLRSESKC